VKTFVLDTNVLLHDPQSIYKFERQQPRDPPSRSSKNSTAIKGEQSTERAECRASTGILQNCLPDSRSMHEGGKALHGGTLSIISIPTLRILPALSPRWNVCARSARSLEKGNRIIAARCRAGAIRAATI